MVVRMADQHADAAVQVVRWANELSFDDIPGEVVDTTKRRLLDLVGAMLAGTQAEGISALVDLVRSWGGHPSHLVVGAPFRTSLPLAVLVNAAVGRAYELDDVHEKALLHPTVATAPIALGMAERDGRLDGRRILTALVAAQEFMCRLGLAPDYHVNGPLHRPRGWSFTYQCGVLGGALLGAVLRGHDEATTMDALGNAYTALAGNQQAIEEGALAIRVQQGVAAQTAVQSVALAEAGISGPHQVLEGMFGWLSYWHGGGYDRSAVVDDLGTRWASAGTSIKPYPVCRITHNSLDATLAAVRAADVEAEAIERLVVHVNSQESWDEVVNPLERRRRPVSPMDAQFSLPFVCAVAAVHRAVTLEHLTEQAITDPRVLAVAARVEPVIDDDAVAGTGRTIPMPITVDLHLRDGSVVSRRSTVPRGHPDNALAWDDVVGKVRACARWGAAPTHEDVVDEAVETVRHFEAVDHPDRLLVLMSRARGVLA